MKNITQQLEFYKKEREQSISKIKHLEQGLVGERQRLDQLTGAIFALEQAVAALDQAAKSAAEGSVPDAAPAAESETANGA